MLQHQDQGKTQSKEYNIKNSDLKKALLKASRMIKEKDASIKSLQEKVEQDKVTSENAITQLKEKIKAVGEEFYKTEMRLQPEKIINAFEEDKDRYLKVIEDL